MLTGVQLITLDNQAFERTHGRKRKVISWECTGASWRNGRRLPGWVRLYLENGGYIWRPENTPLAEAVTYARSLGFDVSEVNAQIDHWVQTGQGATFKLIRPEDQ